MKIITEETSIAQLLDEYPETQSVFSYYGFKADSKEALLEMLGENTRLKTVLAARQLNPQFFIKTLNETVADLAPYRELTVNEKTANRRPDLLAYIPCPMKQFFKENLDIMVGRYQEQTGKELVCEVPMGCGSLDDFADVWQKNSLEEIPDMIISMGFGDFFRKEFREKFINTGCFRAVLPPSLNPEFVNSGLIDPEGYYTIYSLHPYVFLIDKQKLGDLPVPRNWRDLLNPVYKNNVIVGGHGSEISETILLHYLHEYGWDALARLAVNIKAIQHGAEMAKHAGNGSRNGAAIYVLSHFFASTSPKRPDLEILFPDDGMAASPLYMLVKAWAKTKMKPVIDFVFGELYGRQSLVQYFPVINGAIANPVYNGKKIKWIGWDFINQTDIFELRELATTKFGMLLEAKALNSL